MTLRVGYTLSSEEHGPRDLVRYAARAERAGFEFALVSDHFHPWIDRQGHSPFVWSVIGGVATATERLRLGTGVTCPIIRIHPAILAQATATAAAMMPGRFFFGVGTGENLNEHVLGDRWPSAPERLEMLEEAIDVIRRLWTGDSVTHRGKHFTVDHARLYTLPDEAPPLMIAAAGPRAMRLAGEIGDGLISVTGSPSLLDEFDQAGGEGKPRYGQIHVCWAEDEARARKTAVEWWPNTSIKGEAGVELPLPRHFEQLAEMVSEDDVAQSTVCGPDPEGYLDKIREFSDAGYDHVYLHQVGPDQEPFIDFCEREILPKVG